MQEIKKINNIPKFIHTIGMIPTSYKVSLTYEEQIMWFCDFLENTVIPTVNQNALATQEIQDGYVSFTENIEEEISDFKNYMLTHQSDFETLINNQQSNFEYQITSQQSNFESEITSQQSDFENEIYTHFQDLHNYVTSYFDNLDVQNEIDNKLDEMTQDGTLGDIINEQIFNELSSDVSDLQSDVTNLQTNVTKINENLVCIEGTIPDSAWEDSNHRESLAIEYPQGFTKDNCSVISLSGGIVMSDPDDFVWSNFGGDNGQNWEFDLQTNKIWVEFYNQYWSGIGFNMKFRLVLQKFETSQIQPAVPYVSSANP